MNKKLLWTIFLGSLLLIPPAAAAQAGSAPTGPDPELVTKAQQGDTAAQKKLGDYYFGHNDPENGLKWVKKSAEAGNTDAQNSLGFRYEKGMGVTKDALEARKWYLMASEKGYSVAQANLCSNLSSAVNAWDPKIYDPIAPITPLTGSKADRDIAMKWCTVSANRGAGGSQYNLGLIYSRGSVDHKPDYAEAYFWLSLKNGPDIFRDKVGNKLTAEQRAEIETRAKEWRPVKNPPPPQ